MSEALTRSPTSIDHVRNSLRAACLLEATARKPGNVHPEAGFHDLTFEHFRAAAEHMPALAAQPVGVGRAIYDAIFATREIAPSNANLGIVLLLAPLAAVPLAQSLQEGIGAVLERLSVTDADWVYRAIRLASPGGLGNAPEQDVARPPTETLLHVMSLAAHRDRIAFQYAHRFVDVLEFGAPYLARTRDFERNWETAILQLQLELLARIPDTLIIRKCGPDVAAETSRRARQVLLTGGPATPDLIAARDEFDQWLRGDGNRRNPGTTADLIAACLFAALRDGLIPIPAWCRPPQNQELSVQ